jgi:hypothetical protein
MELKLYNKEKDSDSLVIYHQNIMSLNTKGDEINVTLEENLIRPHLICLSEHHMRKLVVSYFSLSGYKLATSLCRKKFLKGGVCILVRNDIIYHD